MYTMSKNLKIIISDYSAAGKKTINFNESVKIPARSRVALTSFNASAKIGDLERTIPAEEVKLELFKPSGFQTTVVNIPIPGATYNHLTEMIENFEQRVNAYIRNNTNLAMFGDKYNGARFVVNRPLSKLEFLSGAFENYELITVPTKVEMPLDNVITGDQIIEMDDAQTVGVPFLLQGGGFQINIPLFFGLEEPTPGDDETIIRYSSRVSSLRSLNNEYSLHYNPGTTFEERRLYISIKLSGASTMIYEIPSEDFFDYQTEEHPVGPWSAEDANKYFVVFQSGGNVKFGWTDGTTFTHIGKGLDIQAPWHMNQFPAITLIMKNGTTLVKEGYKGTFNTSPKKQGLITDRDQVRLRFEDAPTWRDIFGLPTSTRFYPTSQYNPTFTGEKKINFDEVAAFELGLLIDELQVQSFSGYTNNDENRISVGRQNALAYFTPETAINASDFILSYNPGTPLYIAFRNTSDIEINSLNVRIIDTYTNLPFKADKITFLLSILE